MRDDVACISVRSQDARFEYEGAAKTLDLVGSRKVIDYLAGPRYRICIQTGVLGGRQKYDDRICNRSGQNGLQYFLPRRVQPTRWGLREYSFQIHIIQGFFYYFTVRKGNVISYFYIFIYLT